MVPPVTGENSSRGAVVRRLSLIVALVALMGTVAYLDSQLWAVLPASHLYYVPILLAAIFFGYPGGLGAAVAAISLYHLTHFVLPGPSEPLNETDVIRLALFLAVGMTTARLANDRRHLGGLARELSRRNQELSALNARLEELSQARADFVAVASHELRTPLTAILGSTAILVDRPSLDPERRMRLLRNTHDAAARLRNTVESLLDAALIESGRFTLRWERVAMDDLMEECRRTFVGVGEERIRFPDRASGIAVDADRNKLLQVLINLVGNAFKYSAPGEPVEISTETEGGRVRIAVTDRGYGIAAEDLPHIFERYYRAEDGRIRATRGAGLGLSVSRDIVRAHGGELTVRSRPGEGAVFTVNLPAAAAQEHDTLISAEQRAGRAL